MNAIQLWEEAGKPRRAILEFESPVQYTSGRKVKTGTKFEAYVSSLQGVTLGYFFNPNAHRAYYVPDGLIKITPVDPYSCKRRLDYAVRCILADRTHGRELDSAFENHDGDQMAAAIIRRARKNPKLDRIIREQFSTARCDWYKIAALRDGLTDEELQAEADQTRKIESRLFFWNSEDAQRPLDIYLASL